MLPIAMDAADTSTVSVTTLEPAPLRRLLLKRLERLLRLRREHEPELNRQGLRLLDHAVFAAYCSCREVGADGEARQVISQARRLGAQAPASPDRIPETSSSGARSEG
jgi:hypothetical protein